MSAGHVADGALPEVWFLTSELEGERAGGFRQERWCRIFLRAGYRVRIFNLRGAFARTEFACDTVEQFDAFRSESLTRAAPVSSLREGPLSRIGRWVKHYAMADLYLPNVLGLVTRASALLATGHGKVLVMASSPPFSLALAGARLKRRFPDRVHLAVDMRDAWAMHNALGGFRVLKRAVERHVLRRADDVMTVSRWLADEFGSAHGVRPLVMYNVATHYLSEGAVDGSVDWSALNPAIGAQRCKLVYTGSTPAGHYDIASFVAAVAALRRRWPRLADRLQFVFVGACSEVAAEARRQGVVEGDIAFVAHLPHRVVRQVQAAADVLLFFAHHGDGNKGVVSTKLFEYFSLGRPLLPLSLHRGSDVDELMRRFCTGSLNAHSSEEMCEAFKSVAERGTAHLPRRLPEDRTPELLLDYEAYALAARKHLIADATR